jgi:hypothetical protein
MNLIRLIQGIAFVQCFAHRRFTVAVDILAPMDNWLSSKLLMLALRWLSFEVKKRKIRPIPRIKIACLAAGTALAVRSIGPLYSAQPRSRLEIVQVTVA